MRDLGTRNLGTRSAIPVIFSLFFVFEFSLGSTDPCLYPIPPKNCKEIYDRHVVCYEGTDTPIPPSGYYDVVPLATQWTVWCDMEADGGGWIRVPVDTYSPHPTYDIRPASTTDFVGIRPRRFDSWGAPPQWLENYTYSSLPAQALAEIRNVSSEVTQRIFIQCRARQKTPTYSCVTDPHHTTHEADWWGLGPFLEGQGTIYATYYNDGCCFGCCRNYPGYAASFAVLSSHQLPLTTGYLRYSGGPGEDYEVIPLPVTFR